jgi:hypothetical protein
LKSIPGGFSGAGGKSRIFEALKVLKEFVDDHPKADEIPVDIFGYSRGAALARP